MPAGVLEYLWFRDNDPWWATLLRAVALIGLVVLFVIKGMHKVPSGSNALRTRFNKVVHYRRDTYDRLGYTIHRRGEAKVAGPGLVIGIPFVHNVMIEAVNEQFEPLPAMIRLQPLREFAGSTSRSSTWRRRWLVSPTTRVPSSMVVPRWSGPSSRSQPQRR